MFYDINVIVRYITINNVIICCSFQVNFDSGVKWKKFQLLTCGAIVLSGGD